MAKNSDNKLNVHVPLDGTQTTDARSLNISQNNSVSPSAPPHINLQNSDISNTTSNSTREKLLITGDDVLIEYVHRLMIAV